MELPLRAIEVTGSIDAQHQLRLDTPLPFAKPGRVRVIILMAEDTDIDEQDWLRGATTNPAFDFLREANEDIYTLDDGKPFYDQG